MGVIYYNEAQPHGNEGPNERRMRRRKCFLILAHGVFSYGKTGAAVSE